MRTRKGMWFVAGVVCIGASLVLAAEAQRAEQPAQAVPTVAVAAVAETAPPMQLTNMGETLPLVSTGHVLTAFRSSQVSAAEVNEIRRAALEEPVMVPKGLQEGNTGTTQEVEHTGHVLTVGPGVRAGGTLYAPSEADSPAFRAAVSAATGMPCDYYDARVGTPSIVLLCTYDCVFTWADFAYADKVAFGNVLADYVDVGCGRVILGQWCYQSDQINWLEGAIMTSAYCPVTVSSSYNSGSYNGDGADCVHIGPPYVGAYATTFLDDCTLVGGAASDGTLGASGEYLSVAWRQDRKVYYSAGNTGTSLGTGEWGDLVGNMCMCGRGSGILYAPSNPDNPAFRLEVADQTGKPCDYYDARISTPSLELLLNYDCVLTWANYSYDDNVAFGDVLAAYVDSGGKVILGQWCYPSDQGNYLAGAIMTPAYCPVTSSSSYNSGIYNGDGTDCVHEGVGAYDTSYLDDTALVAGALTDGTLSSDNGDFLSVSWRSDRAVYYSAGNTGESYGTGEWDELVANICRCFMGCGDPSAGDCCEANGTPGCNNEECCMSVCAYDSYCCEVEWDGLCADEAAQDFHCLDCVCADETTPPTTVLATPPELGSGCACGLVDVQGTASDPDGTLEGWKLEYRQVGGPWVLIAMGDYPVAGGSFGIWDTTALPQGYYNLRLTARNYCGYSSTAVRTVFVDGGYDTVEIDYPTDGHILGGNNVCLDGTVFENWCGSEYTVEYRLVSGGPWNDVDPGMPVYPGTVVNEKIAEWDTVSLGLTDDDYALRVIATNDCGEAKADIIQVTVDNTRPDAKIVVPENCEPVSGVIDIIGTVFDEHIASWTLHYTGGDSNTWNLLASGDYNVVDDVLYEWDTTGLRPCAYTLRLYVVDKSQLGCMSSGRNAREYLVSVMIGAGLAGDLNCDGVIDLRDINPFVNCLATGNCGCP